MSRVFTYRLFLAVAILIAFCILWSLAYELVVGWRWNPALPSEGSRWSLLHYQNARRDIGGLFVAWQHFAQRLVYPPTRSEAIIRALIAATGTLAAIGVAGVVGIVAGRKPKHHGEARFGTIVDAERKSLLAKKGLILGRLRGATIRSDEPSHVLVVGPTRSGKGVSFVIPNGYMWRGSSVWFDPKRENFEAFGAHRQALGDKVFFFSPGERDTHRYNPLDFIRRDARMATDAAVVASFIIPEGTGSSEIWARAGRQLLSALIGYVVSSPRYEGQRHLRAVTLLTSTGVDFLRVLTNIRNDESKYLPSWVVQGLNQFIALEKETRNSAFFNLTAALNPWTNDLVAAATAMTDFDIARLRQEPTAIFIGCSVAQLDVFRPIIKILVQQIHDVLMASMPGPDEPHQVLMMIDEFRQLGKMESLVSKLTINAGYGFRMVLILQDLAQLDEVYGKATRQTTVSACQVKLIIRMNDIETSEYVSDMLGSTTIEVRTPIIRAGQGLLGGRDKSVSYQEKRLMTAAELRQMPATQAVVLVPNAPGFMLRKITYYKDKPYKVVYRDLNQRRLKVPALPSWQDQPLRSMAEVEASAGGAARLPYDLIEPDEAGIPATSAASYAEAIPPRQWSVPTAQSAPQSPTEPQSSADMGEPEHEPPIPDLQADGETAADGPGGEEPAIPFLKPKADDAPEPDAPRPLPVLGRRAAPGPVSSSKARASVLQFQTRPGNRSMSVAALLASIDQEVEAGSQALAQGAAEPESAPAALITGLQEKIKRHGDRRAPPITE